VLVGIGGLYRAVIVVLNIVNRIEQEQEPVVTVVCATYEIEAGAVIAVVIGAVIIETVRCGIGAVVVDSFVCGDVGSSSVSYACRGGIKRAIAPMALYNGEDDVMTWF